MIIKLLLGIGDSDYLNYLSRVLSDHYTDTFEVTACSSGARLEEIVRRKSFDVALLDAEAAEIVGSSAARLTFLLWDHLSEIDDTMEALRQVKKYQRISALTARILEEYAQVHTSGREPTGDRGRITVVWSPVGGAGKTTVSLAYATWLVSQGKKAVYLDLEPFSSTNGIFSKSGKSLSTIFEKMDSDISLLIQSIIQTDASSGINYFSQPNNYDDVRILSAEDVTSIVWSCAENADEVVIDLGSVYDEKTQALFQISDSLLLISDGSQIGNAKLEQFRTQHNEYEQLSQKIVRIANKGARAGSSEDGKIILLPYVQSNDPVVVFKNLSAGYFQAMN